MSAPHAGGVAASIRPPQPSTRPVPLAQVGTGEALVGWQREMERAQVANWFKPTPPAVARTETAEPGGVPSAGSTSAQPASARADRPASDVGIPDALRSPRAVFAADGAPAFQAPALRTDGASPALRAGRAPAPDSAASNLLAPTPFEPSASAASRDPIVSTFAPTARQSAPMPEVLDAPDAPAWRIHEETQVRGQAIWVAMHADAAGSAPAVAQLVAGLRRELQARGQALWQVVCNGRLVWRADAPILDSVSTREA